MRRASNIANCSLSMRSRNVNKAVSDYMREMQRRSAESRWSGMTAAEKSTAMKALRAKGKRKPKARALRQKRKVSDEPI